MRKAFWMILLVVLALGCLTATAQDQVYGGKKVLKKGKISRAAGVDYTAEWVYLGDVRDCYEQFNGIGTLDTDSATIALYTSAYTIMDTTGSVEQNVTFYISEYDYAPNAGPVSWVDSVATNYDGSQPASGTYTTTVSGFPIHGSTVIAPDDNILPYLWAKVEFDSVNADVNAYVTTTLQWSCIKDSK
jgi:hypothetical protein